MNMSEDLTVTESLMMEVLTARMRLGENLWTFDSDMKGAAKSLAVAGLVYWKHGIVEGTIMVWMRDEAKAQFLTYDYKIPVDDVHEHSKRLTEEAIELAERFRKTAAA